MITLRCIFKESGVKDWFLLLLDSQLTGLAWFIRRRLWSFGFHKTQRISTGDEKHPVSWSSVTTTTNNNNNNNFIKLIKYIYPQFPQQQHKERQLQPIARPTSPAGKICVMFLNIQLFIWLQRWCSDCNRVCQINVTILTVVAIYFHPSGFLSYCPLCKDKNL
jgi:hypothetical protein